MGVVLALGMAVRLGGAVLAAYLLAVVGVHLLDTWRLEGFRAALASRALLGRALAALCSAGR